MMMVVVVVAVDMTMLLLFLLILLLLSEMWCLSDIPDLECVINLAHTWTEWLLLQDQMFGNCCKLLLVKYA